MRFFFLSCWLGTLFGHVVGIEASFLGLGCVLCIGLGRWIGRRWSALLVVCLLTAWMADARQTGLISVFDTYSVGEIRGEIETVRCITDRGCSLKLSRARFQGTSVLGKVTLHHPGPVSGLVGQELTAQVRFRLDRRWSNPNGTHPALNGDNHWRAFSTERPEFTGGGDETKINPTAGLSRRVQVFVDAIVWGDKSGLSPDMRDAFIDTGLAHVLAISGLHMGIVAWSFYKLVLVVLLAWPRMRNIGAPTRWAAGLTILMVWTFVSSIVTSPATLRAAVVITFFLVGGLVGRRGDPLRTLAWAATVLIFVDPGVAFTASFQLSFSAALAILLAHRRLMVFIQDYEQKTWTPLGRFRRGIFSLMTLNAAAWSVTTPLCLAFFGQMSFIGLLVNLGLLPLASMVVIPLAFVYAAVHALSPSLGEPLGEVVDLVLGLFLDLVDGWAQLASSSQTAAIDHWLGLLLTVVVLANLHRCTRLRIASLATVFIVVTFNISRTPDSLQISMFDVGHGDAALVQTPQGATMLIDSGGSGRNPKRNIALANRTLIPGLSRSGVSTLDVAVVTHAHADHMGALERLARRIHIRELWIGPCGVSHPMIRRVAARITAQGGTVKVVHRGSKVSWAGVHLQVLWPPKDSVRPNGTCRFGLNDASVVIRLGYGGRRVLFVGDLERVGEEGLMELEPDLSASLLKVGHHGSRSSSSSRFLRAVAPKFALMSGDLRTGRMPPHAEVIDRLQRHLIRTWITGRDGSLTFDLNPHGLISSHTYSSGRTLRGGGRSIDAMSSW